MTDVVPSSEPEGDRSILARRNLLRGGAVLAGAAGAVALSAVTQPAYAANGDPVVQGQLNDAGSATRLRIGGATTGDGVTAALSLENANGPSLQLQALASDWDGALSRGQIANTAIGPSIGIVDPDGADTVSYLATEFDLLSQPQTQAFSPDRVVDTRYAAQRGNIINTPASSFTGGKLKAGATMTLTLGPADADVTLLAAFLNVVAVAPLNAGYITLYPEGTRPLASTLNFAKNQTIANGAFVGLGVESAQFVVKVFTNQTTHVIVDLSGVILQAVPGPEAVSARKSAPGHRQPRARAKAKVLGKKI